MDLPVYYGERVWRRDVLLYDAFPHSPKNNTWSKPITEPSSSELLTSFNPAWDPGCKFEPLLTAPVNRVPNHIWRGRFYYSNSPSRPRRVTQNSTCVTRTGPA